MVIKSVNLETVCGITSTFPDNPYPEVAFAGKSNPIYALSHEPLPLWYSNE